VTLVSGQRVRERDAMAPLAAPRGGELREILHFMARVEWDPGQEQPGGALDGWVALDRLAAEVVHVLVHGLPMCGFTRDVPRDWPGGHVWTRAGSGECISCSQCRGLEARRWWRW